MNNSQTPAWNAHSKTPNPYANPAAGGQTPGRPAWGGATPGRPTGNTINTWGGATPGRPTGSTTTSWGGATPGRPTGGAGGWGDGGATGSWSAETPAAYSAPTPAAGGAYSSAPTPGMYGAAPTPAFTPGMGVGAPVTPAAWAGWDSGEAQQEGDGELASDWIYDPLFASVFTRLIVQVEGTRLDQYLDGQFEGKQGKIIAGQKSAEIYDQTALVEFEDDKGTKSSRSMLTKYLSPIQPLKSSDECLVLGGQYKGHVATVRETPPEDPLGKVVVSLRDGVWEELSKGSLALLAQQERSSS
jgi:transcription elongation factor SPT5